MEELTVRLSRRKWESIKAPEPTSPEPWRWLGPEDLSAAIALLPSPYAEVMRMSVDERLCWADISRRLNIPIQIVGARLFRGRRQLLSILRDRLPPAVREQVSVPRW